ncbi:MAG: hypothetical protein LDL33_00655 [Desulfomonile sp.]|nr:hypothetical protein [Desulfomonile sp.]
MVSLRLVAAMLVPLTIVLASEQDARPAHADQADKRIDRLLDASGVAKQLEMIGPAVLSAIPWDAFPDQKARTHAEAAVRQNAGKERLLPIVRHALAANYEEEHADKLIEFYDSKLGRKVSRLVGNSLDQEALKNIWEGRTIVTGMSDERRAVLERLVKIEIAGEGNGRLARAVVRGLVKGFLDHALDGGDLIDDIEPKLEAVEAGIAASDRRTMDIALAGFAHALRTLTDAEIKELLAFQESDHAAWFRQGVQAGLEAAVFSAATTLGEALTLGQSAVKGKKQGSKKILPSGDDPGGKDLVIGVPKAQ